MRHRGYKNKSVILLTSLCLIAVIGCTPMPSNNVAEPSISRDDLLSGEALFDPKDTNLTLPDAGVMELSDKLRNYLHQNISKSASKKQKLNELLSLMFSRGNLGITYDRSQTLTAEGTSRAGSGNCLGVSYLFTSLARELGLSTHFRNVEIPPVWSMEEDMIYRYRHVNVEVPIHGRKPIVIDADEVNNIPTYEADRISTKNAVAQYYSNKGAEYLSKKDILNAFLHFKKAITLQPQQAEFWSNLGVLYSREEKYNYAESAYLIALALQHDSLSTINNMATLYGKMGKTELKDKYKSLAESQNNKNPYFRFLQATKAFDKGDYSSSLSHIQWAMNHKKKEPKFYALLAQIYEKTNRPDKAATAKLKRQALEDNIKQLIESQAVKIKFRTKTWEIPSKIKHP